MRRDPLGARRTLAAVLLLALITGCGAAASAPGGSRPEAGLTREVVCARYMEVLVDSTGISHSEDSTGVTSPPEAQQHLDGLEALREFGRWASGAQEPAIAENAAAIERQAERVLRRLSPDDSDARATRITRPLYAKTAQLYYDCNAELYRSVMQGEVEQTGACAAPGAPRLEGPNVVVYGSSGGFLDSTCELVQGVRRGDGCEFSTGASVSASTDTSGGGATGSVEVAYDPDTCQALYETGRLSGD